MKFEAKQNSFHELFSYRQYRKTGQSENAMREFLRVYNSKQFGILHLYNPNSIFEKA